MNTRPLGPEPTAQLVRHVIGEQEQDGTHGDPREGRHLGKQGPQRRKQQDGDSQKMQDTEPDHFVPHEQVEKKGNSHRNSRQNQAAAGVAVGQIAGNAADKDEQPGKKGLNRPEKLEKRAPERDVVDPAQHIEPMEKHHEDQVESTNLIEKMDPAAKNRGVVQGGSPPFAE